MPHPLSALCDDLLSIVPEIPAACEALTDREPWSARPTAGRAGGLANLTARLLDTALCHPDAGAGYRALLAAAAAHGTGRQAQGVSSDALVAEYHLLQEAVRRVLARHAGADATRAVFHVDRIISVGARASVVGYHRDAFAAAGRWPAALERLADEPADMWEPAGRR
jgi:hypothetical protein